MSFAFRGITHCDECGTRLGRNEFVVCDVCRERAKEKNKQTVSVNTSKDKISKRYKGYELLKIIADGKIKEKQQFNVYKNGNLYFDIPVYYENGVLRHNGTLLTEILTFRSILNLDFKLIEDEEIDIQAIEEINIDQVIGTDDKSGIALLYINKLIQAVKQLDKRIKQ